MPSGVRSATACPVGFKRYRVCENNVTSQGNERTKSESNMWDEMCPQALARQT